MTSHNPNFFVIGAPKAGTTFLWHLLRQHPDIFMPETKEPWFLSHDDRFEELGWDWYRGLFEPGSAVRAIGEASSCYCMTRLYPNALRRLGLHFPDARIIYCVREPYTRIESAWKQGLSARHRMSRDFAKAVRTYPPILEGSRYGESLRSYREVFPRERIHIVLFDEFKTTPSVMFSRCLQFLGIDPTFVPNELHKAKNQSADKKIDTQAYRVLKDTRLWSLGKRVTPLAIRNLVRAGWQRPMPEPVWTPQLRSWVRDSLEEDTQEFLELAGFEQNPWTSVSIAPANG